MAKAKILAIQIPANQPDFFLIVLRASGVGPFAELDGAISGPPDGVHPSLKYLTCH